MSDVRQRGFTLLEVMVALVIFGLGVAALSGWLGDGVRGASLADRERLAATAARSLLAELGRSRPLADGTTEGDFTDGMHWRLVVDPVEGSQADHPVLQGHAVTLTVSWLRDGRRESEDFHTLLLGSAS